MTLYRDTLSLTFYQVFRSYNYHAAIGDDLISKEQTLSQSILTKLHKLSRLVGLKDAMLPNVLRDVLYGSTKLTLC